MLEVEIRKNTTYSMNISQMDTPKNNLGLILITDRKLCKQPLLNIIKLAIKGGANTVQLREKDLPSSELFKLAYNFKKITTNLNASLIINDRPDIMLAAEADGVHIGKRSIPIKEVRKIIGDNKLIGYSAHNLYEAEYAQNEGADYISISPIFETRSKGNNVKQKPVGSEAIGKVKKNVNRPLIALGGINENNIDKVLENGADGVAVVSNILLASDPFLAARKLSNKLNNYKTEVLINGVNL